jgi:DNA-binding NtrC family response regulator
MNSPTIVPVNRQALAQFHSDNTLLQAAENTAAALKGSRTIEALLHRLLDRVFAQIPATRGAVLKPEQKAGGFDPLAFHETPFRVDSALVAQAIDSSGGILLTQPKSVLCVPVGTLAAIYLENPGSQAFTLQHLQLLIVMAAEAAVPLDFAIHLDTLTAENQQLRQWAHVDPRLIGESAAIARVRILINKVAASDATILILGEMGTGKEVVARAIHAGSRDENRPFVPVNCAAIPEDLIESELFGHERGAFSGAVAQKKGMVEIAHGGTLFLDEVGELSPKLQAALLRFLQEREYQRVGGTQTLHADVRIVAATNRNLEEMVQRGEFREDLYYRLAVITLYTPSLREMREDIPRLAEHFVKARGYLRRRGVVVKGISSAAQQLLTQYDWPGNVRHLQNVIERALVLGESEFIEPEDLPDNIFSGTQVDASAHGYHARVTAFRKEILREALRKTAGDFVKAALLLDISASFLRRQCRDFGIA